MRLILVVSFVGACLLHRSQPELREYCFPNSFNASCGRDSVIVMSSARYGRMNKGQCLTSDYFVGCWADVLYHLDRKCSGRQSCTVSIPDNTLHQLQPCPKDLLAYLESDYVCQRVENRTSSTACRSLGDIAVTSQQSGSLSSLVTDELEFGSSRCPWIISMPKGQKIKVTLMDFGVAFRFSDSGNMCHVYARIREAGLASELTVCGSRSRERSVYVSETSQLEITLMSFKINEESIYFLLNYEAIGCVDPIIPRASWLKRTVDTAVISCNFTTQAWHIVCQGSTWFGKIDNCTLDSLQPATFTLPAESKDTFHYGLLIAVVTGLVLGVVIGVAMLAIVIACHNKKSNTSDCPRELLYGTHLERPAITPENPSDSGPTNGGTDDMKKNFEVGVNNLYEYTHVCSLHHQHIVPSSVCCSDSSRSRCTAPHQFSFIREMAPSASSVCQAGNPRDLRQTDYSLEYRLNCSAPFYRDSDKNSSTGQEDLTQNAPSE